MLIPMGLTYRGNELAQWNQETVRKQTGLWKERAKERSNPQMSEDEVKAIT